MSAKKIISVVLVFVLLIVGFASFNGVVGNNNSGFYQVKQSFPGGSMSVISKPGWYAKLFSKTDEYKVSDTYYFSTSELDGGDDAISDPIGVRFSGGGTADISGSVKYKTPSTEDMRLLLHEDFRSDDAIRQDLIRQYVQEVLKNTATLYKPEDTYSGGRGEFVATFQAQLEEGIYRTESEQIVTADAEGNELTETVVNIIYGEDGKPIIDKVSPFITYNISLLQVSIKDIDYSDKVDELITAKQESEQQKVLAVAKAEQAKQSALTAIEEGKARVAIAEADALVVKKTAIVEAEQAKEVAELEANKEKTVATTKAQKELDVATLEAESAIKDAEALLTAKEAEAKANTLLVTAGLTPKEAAEYVMKTEIGVAEALAKMDVPSVVINGGSDGTSVNPLDFLGINQALDVAERLGN